MVDDRTRDDAADSQPAEATRFWRRVRILVLYPLLVLLAVSGLVVAPYHVATALPNPRSTSSKLNWSVKACLSTTQLWQPTTNR